MSLMEKILRELTEPSIRYKGVPVNILGIPRLKRYPYDSLRTTIWRAHEKCLIEKELNGWILTPAGKRYLNKKANSLRDFDFRFPKDSPRNLIVMFDVPETKKAEREWLRWHLKKFGYIMIQRSVWVGPSPLPKEFLNYIEKIKLKSAIKTFKLARTYNSSK